MSTVCYELGEVDNQIALFKDNKGEGIITLENGARHYLPDKYILVGEWNYFLGELPKISDNLFAIKDKYSGKIGFMNTELNLVVPAIYDDKDPEGSCTPVFKNGVARVGISGKPVVIDCQGKEILNGYEKNFSRISFIEHDGQIRMMKAYDESIDSEGIYDMIGNLMFPFDYRICNVYFDDEKPIYVVANIVDEVFDQYKVFDQNRRLIVDLPERFRVGDVKDGFIRIINEEDGLFGYLTTSGKMLTNCIYGYDRKNFKLYDDESGDFTYAGIMDSFVIEEDKAISEGAGIIVLGDRYGFIDNNGRWIIPLRYTAVTPFENGMAFVRDQNGKWMKIFRKDL